MQEGFQVFPASLIPKDRFTHPVPVHPAIGPEYLGPEPGH